jgi:S-adenosylmethionine:tRNA ribosyltransferase-isomerase
MKLSDFDFDLPLELVAQEPCHKRDHSNLLVALPGCPAIKTHFYNIIDYLKNGDVIVFNNSRVIKAKIILDKSGRKIEFYLNKKLQNGNWLGFAKPAKKLKEGDIFEFGADKITVLKKWMMGETEVAFDIKSGSFWDFLEQHGQIPLPPYIKRKDAKVEDELRYQTVYGAVPGSVAAPTAGLHFTKELIEKIKSKGVQIIEVTLHVGSGTFLPVKVENIKDHEMHSEYCSISQESARIISGAKRDGRRIIAVGTTSLRVLESASLNGIENGGDFETNIFITPGFKFSIVDLLVTNFHLPKSTLFMLVCAFAGFDEMKSVYSYAINQRMRFFSYGDAMLLGKK